MITLMVKRLFKGSYEDSDDNVARDLDMGCVLGFTMVIDIILCLWAFSEFMEYLGYA